MSFEIQQRKFVSFSVCLNQAGRGKEHICRSDFISALGCVRSRLQGYACVHVTRDKALLQCFVHRCMRLYGPHKCMHV